MGVIRSISVLRLVAMFMLVGFLCAHLINIAHALSPEQKKLYQSGIYYFDLDNCSPAGSTVTNGETTEPPEAVQQVVWDTLTAGGIDEMHTAAVMGNIAHEGAWDPMSIGYAPNNIKSKDPATPPDKSEEGYGLIGWTPGTRLTDMMKEANISGKPYTAETQAAVLLAAIEGKTPTQYAPSVGKNFLATKNIADATTAYQGTGAIKGFENPLDPVGSLPDRIKSAKEMLDKYGGSSGGSSSSSSSGGECQCGGGSTNIEGGTPAEQAFNFFISKGLSAEAAAGIVGNLMDETGGGTEKLDTHAHNDISGTHDGIAQWSTSRWATLKKHAGGKDIYDLKVQLDFLWYELSKGGYETVLKKLKSAKTSDEAAKIFNAEFEVSGVDPSSRQTNAKKILQKYGDNAAGSGTGTDCGATGDCTATKPVWGSQNGSGDEYSQEQLTKLFGNPGTASSHPEMDKNLTEVKFLGHDVQINKKAAGCLEAVSSQLQGTSYKIRMIGCYRYDSNNGSSNIGLKSYHTYGVACDINWDTNPYIGDGSAAAHDMPDEFVKAFRDHGFTWGGNWSSVKDYMHFEFNGIKPD